jgi:hypothetical protein
MVRIAKARHLKTLQRLSGVVTVYCGVKMVDGQFTGQPCVVVGVRRKLPASSLDTSSRVPTALRLHWYSLRKSVMTDVRQVGTVVARKTVVADMPAEAIAQAPTDRVRPALGGVSVGHVDITAGTLGVVAKKDGNPVILSNNHVLANSNAGAIGDTILQPGKHDGGQDPADRIGTLSEFVEIRFDGAPGVPDQCQVANAVIAALNWITRLIGSASRYQVVDEAAPNLVDAALARPDSPEQVRILEVLGAGEIPVAVTGDAEAQVGDAVKKSGRTTGHTTGEIIGIDGSVQVQYGEGQIASFEDQLIIEPAGFSAGGDSGSVILNEHNQVVGLLFAGSDEITIANRVSNVTALLGVSFRR